MQRHLQVADMLEQVGQSVAGNVLIPELSEKGGSHGAAGHGSLHAVPSMQAAGSTACVVSTATAAKEMQGLC